MSDRVPDNLRAMGLMACAALVFAVEAALVRVMLARGIPVTTQVAVRALGQAAWVMPYLIAAGVGLFRTQRAGLHLFRGLCSVLTWAFYYLSFVTLDLATATVLSFTNVMFTTLLARPVLGEQVGAARWAGTLAGFVGVAVMLRPEAQVDPWGAGAAVLAATAWCGITLSTRRLARTDGLGTILAWLSVVTVAAAMPAAWWGWRPLDGGDLLWLLLFGSVTPAIIWFMTRALTLGEASAVAPFQYLRLIVIVALGWWLYGEVPDGWAFVGAGFILGGAVVITVAEARRRA